MSEKLVVELDARTEKLQAGLKKSGKDIDDFEGKTTKADSSLFKMSNVASVAGSAIVAFGTSAVVAASALSTMIVMSAKSQQELSRLSSQAKLSTSDFEALSFATKQYGIDAESMADISKDIADRLGEFSKAGTGPFQDYADVVGLSRIEAQKAAKEFENMSSDQVIGAMVRSMEGANATTNQMIYALESMGSELSTLLPLFADGSKELEILTGRYNKMASQMAITAEEGKKLQGTATSFNLMTASMGKASALISAQLAPIMDSFFGSVIEVVPTATQAVVNFINSFKTPDEITNLISVQDQIKDATEQLRLENEELLKVEERLAEASNNRERSALNRMLSERKVNTAELTEELKLLTEQENKLTEQRVSDAEKLKNSGINASTNGGSDISTTGTSGTADEVQAIADRFKTEEELLYNKLQNELLIIGENNELKLQLENQYLLDLMGIEQEYEDERVKRIQDTAKKEADAKDKTKTSTDKANRAKEKSDGEYLDAANSIGNTLFSDNKLISSGLAVVNTAVGITKALATQNYAGAAATAIAGAAQIAAINSATTGGGGSADTGISSTAPTTPDFDSDSTINVDSRDTTGLSNSVTIRFEGSGDEITEAIAKNMKIMELSGNL